MKKLLTATVVLTGSLVMMAAHAENASDNNQQKDNPSMGPSSYQVIVDKKEQTQNDQQKQEPAAPAKQNSLAANNAQQQPNNPESRSSNFSLVADDVKQTEKKDEAKKPASFHMVADTSAEPSTAKEDQTITAKPADEKTGDTATSK